MMSRWCGDDWLALAKEHFPANCSFPSPHSPETIPRSRPRHNLEQPTSSARLDKQPVESRVNETCG
jgi:hypothetical protein